MSIATDFIRYIDPVNGSDSYDGLSEKTAWKTPLKVAKEMPVAWTGRLRIQLINMTPEEYMNALQKVLPPGRGGVESR